MFVTPSLNSSHFLETERVEILVHQTLKGKATVSLYTFITLGERAGTLRDCCLIHRLGPWVGNAASVKSIRSRYTRRAL